MKKIITILSCALALGAGLSAARGTEPALARTGRVLILDNEKTWTGDVERVGDQYRVKRLVGETWIQASRVLQVCATLEDAHRFMQSRANLEDPDERLRLAEWCRQHNLLTQASAEANAAFALKPDDPKIKHLMNYLAQAKAQADLPRPAPPPERATPRVDLTAEALGQFASKVQPILMNACVNCHNSGRPNGFLLVRTSGGLNNRRSLEQNLAAVMAEVNLNNPASSRLLQKAVSIHAPGMTQGPLKNRQVLAYQTMEQWVRATLDNNPHLREQAVASVNPPPMPVPIPPQQPPAANGGTFGQDRETATKSNDPMANGPTPAAPKASDDPADPSAFNREFHPERKQP